MAGVPIQLRLDCGWLYIIAGLVACAAGLLVPAQHDVLGLQQQLARLHYQEAEAQARLKAHADFLDAVDRRDPVLVRRLAAAQLNLMPANATAILLSSTASAPITDWLELNLAVESHPIRMIPVTRLTRLADGPHRLWLLAGAVMCVFVGVVLDPAIGRGRDAAAPHKSTSPQVATKSELTTQDSGLPKPQVPSLRASS